LPNNAPEINLTIRFVGSHGDGIGTAWYKVGYETKDWPFYVPGSLEGEQVRVKPQQVAGQGVTAELVELLTPNPSRSAPVCDVFAGLKGCGGCSLQHMNEAAYRDWKLDQLKCVFDKAGFGEDHLMAPSFARPVWTQMSGRRRVRLSYRRTAQALIIGFTGRASHFIYPLESCGVLQMELKQLITQLNDWAGPHLPAGQSGQIAINLLSSGADILLLPDETLASKVLTALSTGLNSLPVCRLSVSQPDSDIPLLLAEKAPAVLQLEKVVGGQNLYPSPGSFLQASTEAETALIQAVLRAVAARIDRLQSGHPLRIMDLYSGVGTFTLPLLSSGAIVTCYEADQTAVDSLLTAARTAELGQSCSTHRRDLVAAPVRAEEFCAANGEPQFDLILLDPPRQGAAAQTAQLVALVDLLHGDALDRDPDIVPDVVMVSCNPHTAVRDISALVAAGWQLEEVQMIDQFVRTTHIEIVNRLVFVGRQKSER
tara:strand:+ start:69 stop:1520 length:1452 start_codon:yes stop_codon:yes gene_type:complete